MRFLTAVAAVALVSVACAGGPKVPMASKDADAAAKKYEPAPGRANLYVSRNNESLGSGIPFRLSVDGKAIASLMPGTFALISLDPGKHDLLATADRGLFGGDQGDKSRIDVHEGKNYFYEVAAKSEGSIIHAQFSIIIFERMGRLAISQSRRVLEAGE